MRKLFAICTLGATLLVGSTSTAGAEEKCPRPVTHHAHETVPHENEQAHRSIPYCPGEDAPGQARG